MDAMEGLPILGGEANRSKGIGADDSYVVVGCRGVGKPWGYAIVSTNEKSEKEVSGLAIDGV